MSVVSGLPEVLHTDLHDQLVRICTELGCAGPFIMVLPFAVPLDEARLGRAARLMLDAEPILGCRFEPDPVRPVWRRRDDLDRERWCVVHTVAHPEELIRSLLTPRPEHLDAAPGHEHGSQHRHRRNPVVPSDGFRPPPI